MDAIFFIFCIMFLPLTWIALTVIIGIWAVRLQRSVVLGVLGSFFLSPLVVGIYYLIVGPKNIKKCPDCAETIKKEAKVCRFCHAQLGAP